VRLSASDRGRGRLRAAHGWERRRAGEGGGVR